MLGTFDFILYSFLIIPFVGLILNSMKILIDTEKFDTLISPVVSIFLILVEFILAILIFQKVNAIGEIELQVDNLAIDWVSAVFLVIVQSLLLFIGIFSIYYFRDKGYAKYFTLFFSLQLGLILSITANNFFILFLSWEFLVVTGYILVVFSQTRRAYEAGIKYLIISSFGSLLLLFGIGLLTAVVPSLNFAELLRVDNILSSLIGKLAFIFIIMGFGITAGMIFFNQWLPDAHPEAPAPVSAILSGIVVKVGIYALYRTFVLLAPTTSFSDTPAQLILIIGILTMTEGNLMVFAQFKRKDSVDYKRILAYSTTVHLGLMMIIVPINSDFTIFALLFHILNHGLAKVLLFLLSGYMIAKIGSRDLKDLKGIGVHDKIIGVSLFIGLMSLAGLPGTGGFISKLMIILSFYQSHALNGPVSAMMIVALVLIMINTVLAFIGYLWLIKKLIFEKSEVVFSYEKDSIDWIAKFIYILLSVIILFLGIFPNLYLQYII